MSFVWKYFIEIAFICIWASSLIDHTVIAICQGWSEEGCLHRHHLYTYCQRPVVLLISTMSGICMNEFYETVSLFWHSATLICQQLFRLSTVSCEETRWHTSYVSFCKVYRFNLVFNHSFTGHLLHGTFEQKFNKKRWICIHEQGPIFLRVVIFSVLRYEPLV